MRQSIKTSKMLIQISTGSEGPFWDPYAYTEWHVTFTDGRPSLTLHMGLVEWLKIGDHKHEAKEGLDKVFAEMAGFHPAELEKWLNKARSRCRKCGSRKGEWQSGYPGESFLICVKCGEHMDYMFNESAII